MSHEYLYASTCKLVIFPTSSGRTHISSRLPSVSDLGSIVVGRDHKDFELTGLKVASVIRLDKVATVLKEMVVGEIGSVGDSLKKEVNSQLSKIYLL